jgi:XTP/dITP diphosphohydrolase
VIIYCATSNPGKLREFQLAAPDFELRQLPRPVPPPEETGATFEENAIGKAEYYGGFADGYLFADDSGLEVDALDGAPGVHSARYAGSDATDAANNALLLENIREHADHSARFVCVIALVKDGKLVRTFRGAVEGRILDSARGSGGFGYDPLFYYEPFECTFGEAPIADKMRVSHRAQALEAMFTFLRSNASSAETRSSSSHR